MRVAVGAGRGRGEMLCASVRLCSSASRLDHLRSVAEDAGGGAARRGEATQEPIKSCTFAPCYHSHQRSPRRSSSPSSLISSRHPSQPLLAEPLAI